MNKILAIIFMISSRLAMIMYLVPWVICRGRRLDECIAMGVIYFLASMTLTRIEKEMVKE